ncbi:MAG: nucleotide exchange factor GrpE [Candidatus Gracilibacteria bacterium]
MTNEEKNKLEEQDIIEEIQEELDEIENEDGTISEEKLEEVINPSEVITEEDEKCADILARTMADFDNFRKRTERDKHDMIFFLKQDIFSKILPRLDDIERIIKNTPIELQDNPLFEGIVSMQKKLLEDLLKMGVKQFDSKGDEVNPDMHDVMTTVPGKDKGIIFDEFEKGYKLGDKILRHAKVIVGAGK